MKEYCESNWDEILKNSEQGQYSKLDPDKFLKDACFKASWVMNVLHEGFELPRIGFETEKEDQTEEDKKITNAHVPFKSADSVEGEELSWTLGKILLFASSQIEPKKETPRLSKLVYIRVKSLDINLYRVVSCYLVMVIIQLTMKMMIWWSI